MKSNGRGDMLPLVEEFYSLQGEGFHTGTAACFVRLGGCDTGCPWCDSAYARDLANSRPTSVGDIVQAAAGTGAATVVVTGGEPLMHDLGALTDALHGAGMRVHLETSGTHPLSGVFDWVCLSPKRMKHPTAEAFGRADELKVVAGCADDLRWAEECAAKVKAGCRLFLQPEWGRAAEAVAMIVDYVKRHPEWRMSLQTHKYIDIP